MNYALIDNTTNIVDNVIVLDEGSTWAPPSGYYMVNIDGLEVGIGWTYNPQTREWTPPVGYVAPVNTEEVSGTTPNVIG